MSVWRRFAHRWMNLFRRHRAEEELQREVDSHLALLQADFEGRGLSPHEAYLAARRAYGSVELAKELQRDARSWIGLERLRQDARFALRCFGRSPGFTCVVIATLALGMGSNTAIFSLVDRVLLQPLPYRDSNAIVHLSFRWRGGERNDTFEVGQFEFLRDHASTLQSIGGYRSPGGAALATLGNSRQWLSSLQVTDGFLSSLGIRPALGRDIRQEETRIGSPHVALLANSLWRQAFGADPAVLGRQVALGDAAYTVIGVLPEDFVFYEHPADLIVGLQLGRTIEDTGLNTHIVARLRPDVSETRAQANLDSVFADYRRQGLAQPGQGGVGLERYQKWLAGDFRTSIQILLAAVMFLLLIACANVAGLLVARSAARQREISIRLAIGSSRSRLLQQFLVESLILALAGTGAGLIAAAWTLRGLVPIVPWNQEAFSHVSVNGRVLLFAAVLMLLTTLIFGLTGLWQTSESALNDSLKRNIPARGHTAAHAGARSLFVVFEIAVSAMLLVGAGLLIDMLHRLHQQKLGFEPDRVSTMVTRFEKTGRKPSDVWTFEQQVLRRLMSTPGIQSAAIVSDLPLTGPYNLPTQHEGHPEHSIGGMEIRYVSPQYFRTMSIKLLTGRSFSDNDSGTSRPVALVSETVAHTWWGNASPIGDRLVVGEYGNERFPEIVEPPREIVGVVSDVKNYTVDERSPTTLYVPSAQMPRVPGKTAWVIKTGGASLTPKTLADAVLAVDPETHVEAIQPMSDIVAHSISRPTFSATLMGAFSSLALLLTGIGVYGVLSFQVERRRHEIGIRVALGASRNTVVRTIVGQSLVLTALGTAIGGVGALFVARLIASLVPGIHLNQPVLYPTILIVLLVTALVAAYVPAQRASSIDPAISLRYE